MRTTPLPFQMLLVVLLAFAACSDDNNPIDASVDDQRVVDVGPDAPTTTLCERATPLTLEGGSVRVTKTTSAMQAAPPDPQCAGDAPALAPKIVFSVTAAADQWYKLVLEPRFDAHLYIFSDSACGTAEIEADCDSNGADGDKLGPVQHGETGVLFFKRAAAGTFYIVVKAAETTPGEFFTLEVSEFTPPANGSCDDPAPVPLAGGSGSVAGDTDDLMTPDEFPGLGCGSGKTFNGPQVYYSFTATAGISYKIELKPSFDAEMYVFPGDTACSESAIESACASDGAQGDTLSVAAGASGALYFVAPADGEIVVGVDSADPSSSGQFTLGVVENVLEPPENYTCVDATPISFSGGTTTITGTTLGALNEYGNAIDCDGFTAYDGPQVYYRLTTAADKAYRIKLTPEFASYLYLFEASDCGDSSAINEDCGSEGLTGAKSGEISADSTETVFFQPSSAGDYLIAVDSSDDSKSGIFTLQVDELDPPANAFCVSAQQVALSSGSLDLDGTTAFAPDEFAMDPLTCGGPADLVGSQVYYTLGLAGGKLYKFELQPAFDEAHLYLFRKSAGCQRAEIEADCASGGATGGHLGPVDAGESAALYFIPPGTAEYDLVIDSTEKSDFGDFTVKIAESDPPQNTTCALPKTLVLGAEGVTEIGSTIGAANEFGTAISCGGAAPFEGGQVYYKVDLVPGGDYRVRLAPDFDAELYIFSAGSACSSAAIETDCASGGTSGDTLTVDASSTGTINFVPTGTSYYVVVDSASAAAAGGFTLTINEFKLPTFTAPFALDFENSGGGLAFSGDWEWGHISWAGGTCGTPPANSEGHAGGTGMWGTVLNNCYNNLGNAQTTSDCDNAQPDDDSILAFKVEIPAGWTSATLSYWEWVDVFTPYDFVEVYVDGELKQQVCQFAPAQSWQLQTIDLGSYAGQTVKIELHMSATDVVADAGWYIDELAVTGSGPGSDAGVDAGPDAGIDAAADAGSDSAPDATADAVPDGAPDTPQSDSTAVDSAVDGG